MPNTRYKAHVYRYCSNCTEVELWRTFRNATFVVVVVVLSSFVFYMQMYHTLSVTLALSLHTIFFGWQNGIGEKWMCLVLYNALFSFGCIFKCLWFFEQEIGDAAAFSMHCSILWRHNYVIEDVSVIRWHMPKLFKKKKTREPYGFLLFSFSFFKIKSFVKSYGFAHLDFWAQAKFNCAPLHQLR